jgi:hypothetical protein
VNFFLVLNNNSSPIRDVHEEIKSKIRCICLSYAAWRTLDEKLSSVVCEGERAAFEILFPYKPFSEVPAYCAASYVCLLLLNMNMTDNKSFD